MKNLSPHRKFRGVAYVPPLMGHHYQRPWPEDLPKQCQICGTEFRTGWNIEVEPNRIGRILRKAATLSFLPAIIGFAVGPFLPAGLFGEYGGLYYLILIFSPIALGLASLFAPTKRHLECKKCGWNKDYPQPKATPVPATGEHS